MAKKNIRPVRCYVCHELMIEDQGSTVDNPIWICQNPKCQCYIEHFHCFNEEVNVKGEDLPIHCNQSMRFIGFTALGKEYHCVVCNKCITVGTGMPTAQS